MSKSQNVPPEDMYCAIGKATTAWQFVEDALRDVFSRILICSIGGSMLNVPSKALNLTGIVFFSSTNLRARLAMMDSLVEETVTDPALASEWNAIKNKVLRIYNRRNTLAHSYAWGNETIGLPDIRPPYFVKNAKTMTFQQILASERSFRKTAERVTAFAIAINKHLVA